VVNPAHVVKHAIQLRKEESHEVPEPKPDLAEESVDIVQFDYDKLLKHWNDYASKLKEQKKLQLYSTLTKRQPILKDGNVLLLVIDNKVQEEDLNNEKYDLLLYLKEKMNSGPLQLITEIEKNEEETGIRPYTTKEKFEKMAEENPILNEIKKIFDLNVDF
jgi:DNA polymerase-3 subunit gamma/tau